MPVTTAHSGPIGIAEFDAAPAADAAAELVPCCSSKRWVSSLVKGRPYRTLDRLVAASDQTLGRLDWADLSDALASDVRVGPAVTTLELAEGYRAYEQRFGHAFLLCAPGLGSEELLQSLRSRLVNDPIAEREVVRSELKKIVRQRLASAFR
jgi:2-oxo-4-hydroxy-4-carboxy-5-ureidoimidazoline decarboxylase